MNNKKKLPPGATGAIGKVETENIYSTYCKYNTICPLLQQSPTEILDLFLCGFGSRLTFHKAIKGLNLPRILINDVPLWPIILKLSVALIKHKSQWEVLP